MITISVTFTINNTIVTIIIIIIIVRSSKTEEKLALSYAMAQSSKLFVFELKVLQSLEKTRFLPKELGE